MEKKCICSSVLIFCLLFFGLAIPMQADASESRADLRKRYDSCRFLALAWEASKPILSKPTGVGFVLYGLSAGGQRGLGLIF